jgi:hypothetical protein
MIRSPILTNKGLFHGYGIDEYGNIYNLKGKLTWHINEHGYANIALCRDGKSYYFKIHRLVMFNFGKLEIRVGEGRLDVNHKDGNKLNNHVSNLEWATRSENLYHAYKHKLKVAKPKYGISNPNGKYDDETIMNIIHLMYIELLDDQTIADKCGCSKSLVNHIRNGRIRKKDVERFKALHLI